MLKCLSLLLFLLLSILACDNRKNVINSDTIYSEHQKIDSISKNSVYKKLKNLEKQLFNNSHLPDSLRAKNNDLLGRHFEKINQLDSAAYYYHEATYLTENYIKNYNDAYYYLRAFNTYYLLKKLGDCTALFGEYKEKINFDTDFILAGYYYYMAETTYTKQGKLKEALEANKKRIYYKNKLPKLQNHHELIAQHVIKLNMGLKEEAIIILKDLSRKDSITNLDVKTAVYNNMGGFYFFENDFKKAIKNYNRSLHYLKQTENSNYKKTELSNDYSNIAEAYIELNNFKKASIYIDSAKLGDIKKLSYSIRQNILKYELRLAYKANYPIENIENQLNLLIQHQNESYAEKYTRELNSLVKANENEKIILAEKQNTEVNNIKLKQRQLLIIISSVIAGIIGFFVYLKRTFKFQKIELQMQQRLLRSQMNPHFTFNTLYQIQNKIKESSLDASKYLQKFSRLLRLILENSMHNYIQIEKEIDAIEKYLELQELRFPKLFKYSIAIRGFERDELLFIPPMLLQPFIENSIEHGFKGINYEGNISITLTLNKKFIDCIIEDNGIGLVKKETIHKKSASFQLINSYLKKATNKGILLVDKKTINSNQKGIEVSFLIPFKNSEHD